MRISFRQGIVAVPAGFLQSNGTTVNLVTPTPDSVVVTFADGAANYLHTERLSVTSAWTGPFTPGTSYWLYWDINTLTGVRTFGHTLLEPIQGSTTPVSPANDQHWFDTNVNRMKVWNTSAGRWINKIRVFAAKLDNGTVFTSVGIDSPVYEGTQIGTLENVPVAAGALVFDVNGDPIKRNGGYFFTTEDVIVASVASATQVKLGSIVVEAVSISNIPAYSIVTFSAFHQVQLATNMMLGQGAYGMIEVDAITGDIVSVATEGLITNPEWNWTSAGVNTPLYVSSMGTLTTTAPPNPVVVAVVVDVNTILLRPSMQVATFSVAAPPGYQNIVAMGGETVINTTVSTTAKTSTTSYLQVFLNGVLQRESLLLGYSVTGTNQITFVDALVAGDEVTIYSFNTV